MNLQPIPNPQNLTTKTAMTSFVHDVATMETQAFTMREAARKVRKEAQSRQRQLEREKINHCERKRKAEDSLSLYQKEAKDKASWFIYNSENHKGLICGYWVVMGVLLLLTIGATSSKNGYVELIMSASVALAWNLFYGIPVIVHTKKKHRELLDDVNSKIQSLQITINDEHQKLLAAQANLQNFMADLPNIEARADRLDADATTLEELIKKHYALDIIKPAYQKMVCVVVLDEIFANDKADTMREAMILCDAEIRHAQVISKLDEVIEALSFIAQSLQGMAEVLDNINTNVGLITQDVYAMRQGQEQMQYSVDAIKRSTDNLDMYINQRRTGSI